MTDDWMTLYTTVIEKERAWKAKMAIRMIRYAQMSLDSARRARESDTRRFRAEREGRASAFADIAFELVEDVRYSAIPEGKESAAVHRA